MYWKCYFCHKRSSLVHCLSFKPPVSLLACRKLHLCCCWKTRLMKWVQASPGWDRMKILRFFALFSATFYQNNLKLVSYERYDVFEEIWDEKFEIWSFRFYENLEKMIFSTDFSLKSQLIHLQALIRYTKLAIEILERQLDTLCIDWKSQIWNLKRFWLTHDLICVHYLECWQLLLF